jgi:signal transduction histidine kinase
MFIDRIVEGATNVYKLLENLLEWSRIQLGGIEFKPESLDISLLVFEIARVNKLSAEKKQIDFSVEIHDHTFVYVDRNMLNTILRNLISNAIKFSKPGGSVKIHTVQSSESDRIPQGFIGVAVTDEGIGISPDDIGSLFKIDSGFHRKGTSNESGTGLGLVLCKEFIDTCGGDIWVESQEGNGSTFFFTVALS